MACWACSRCYPKPLDTTGCARGAHRVRIERDRLLKFHAAADSVAGEAWAQVVINVVGVTAVLLNESVSVAAAHTRLFELESTWVEGAWDEGTWVGLRGT